MTEVGARSPPRGRTLLSPGPSQTLSLLLTLCLLAVGGGEVKGAGFYRSHGMVRLDKGRDLVSSRGQLLEGEQEHHIQLKEDPADLKHEQEKEQLRAIHAEAKAVHISVVREKMQHVRTFHDVLRIFYGYKDEWSNEMVEKAFLSSQQGPLSQHTMAMAPGYGGIPISEGRDLLNTMQSDAPCEDCDVIIPGFSISKPSSISRSHKKRLRKMRERNRQNQKRDQKDKERKNRNRDTKKKHKKKKEKGKGQKAMRQATRHIQEVTLRTECSVPVPVCVNARGISTAANKMYFPECTIVYQCREDSGCCPAGQACASVKHDTIRRYFWEVEMQAGEKVNLQVEVNSPIQHFSFVNHTRCGCKPVKSLPQCLKCPHPYVRTDVNVSQCVCDCPTSQRHRTCEKIKRGRQVMEETQLTCIKENRCHLPTCRHGDFSIAGGSCPHRPKRSEKRVKKSRGGELHQRTQISSGPSSERIQYGQASIWGK